MADNNDNDEYKFDDLENYDPESAPEPDKLAAEASPKKFGSVFTGSSLRRNVIITVVVIILLFIFYKFIHAIIGKKPAAPVAAVTPPVTPVVQPKPAPVVVPPVEKTPPSAIVPATNLAEDIAKSNQRIATLELNQNNMRQDINVLNSQVSKLDANVSALTAQVSKLSQTVETLVHRIELQSQEVKLLLIRTTPKIKPSVVKIKLLPLQYFLEAVIPGRAWLMASNGSTITVREGSLIPGYGIVKYIDDTEGKVVTSSGKIIKFSQQDS